MIFNRKYIFKVSVVGLFYCLSVVSFALPFEGSPEVIGLAILKEAKKRDSGWKDSAAEMVMTISNGKGNKSIREMTIKTLEIDNDGDKGLMVFNRPRDVKGTAFLTFSHIAADDEQWMYLPALKRVKRISSRNKSGAFMGSEFSYEDLSSFEVEKYTYNYLGEEKHNGQVFLKVESVPRDKFSGYSRLVIWLDNKEYRFYKIDYYDKTKAKRKTLENIAYKIYRKKYWRPDSQVMINHVTGYSTELKMNNISFGSGLGDSDFNKNALKRIR